MKRGTVIDIEGKRFGFLVAKEKAGQNATRHMYWVCLCDCGKEVVVRGTSLRQGDTTSCGCYIKNITSKRSIKHGHYGTLEYAFFHAAIQRCNNPNATGYEYYGGRGIKFLFNSFEEFYNEIG